jgi:hypothetical protein
MKSKIYSYEFLHPLASFYNNLRMQAILTPFTKRPFLKIIFTSNGCRNEAADTEFHNCAVCD